MFSSLKSKMLVPIIGMLFLMVAFIFVYVSVSTTNLVDRFSDERMSAATQSVRAYLSAYERQTFAAAAAMGSSAELIRLIHAGVREDIWQYTADRKLHLGVDEIIVGSADGITLARSHLRDSFGDTISGVPSVAAALRGESITLYTPTPTAAMVMTSTSPIMDAGTLVGSVVVNFVVGREEFLDRLSTVFDMDATVFVRDGTSVSSTLIHPVTGQRAVGTVAAPHIVEAVIGRGEHMTLDLNVFGMLPFSAYYFPLPGVDGLPNGMFFIGISQEHANATISTQQRNMIIIAVSSLVIVAFVILMFIIRMLKPISLLTYTLNDTANGDLTKRLPDSGKDEIANASRSFNQTMEELRKMINVIKNQSGMLSSIGNDLASNMTQTASAMNEIAANIQSIKGRVLNQSASVTETNATMEQVTININKLNGNVEQQDNAVNQAATALNQVLSSINSVTATLEQNVQNVKALEDSAGEGKISIEEVVADIREIARESEGLLEINAVMENIAGQTSLLSMNAAIEAARAGESGKGFAVVASEVRKLAESSEAQSKTIGNVLKNIKNSIDKITRSTDNVLGKFEAIDSGVKVVAEQEQSILHAMENQTQGGKRVLQASGQVAEMTQQVKGGSAEMLEGSKEVIKESKNLEKTTQEITNGMNEMVAGAEQVNQAVNTVNDLTGKTRENISSLVQAVSRFKV